MSEYPVPCRIGTGFCRNGSGFVGIARALVGMARLLSEWHGVLSECQFFVGMAVFLPECQAVVGMLVIMSEYLFMCQFREAPYNIYHCKEIAHDLV